MCQISHGRQQRKTPHGSTGRQLTTSGKKTTRRVSAELIETTRKLMEGTIEFVDHSTFRRVDASDRILAIRPGTIDEPPELEKCEPGLAFVSGLVQSPLLTPEEERYWFTWMNFLKSRAERNRRRLDLRHPKQSLVNSIQSDLDEALKVRNHIVRGNLRLIVALAKSLGKSVEQMSELISEGMTPMIRSVELFNIGLGNRFSTYATWAVRNQMLRYLKRIRTSPEFQLGEDAPSLENLPDRRPKFETVEAVPSMRAETVSHLMFTLSERERAVISARFGLDGNPSGQSLADIAEQVGLSKERVRQIVMNCLAKLRQMISDDEYEAMI